MATLSITVPDAVATRIRNAFGTTNQQGVVTPASVAEVEAAIKNWLRERVIAFEPRQDAAAKEKEILAEVW